MSQTAQEQATPVIRTLRAFRAEIDALLVALEGKKSLPPDEIEHARELLRSFKAHLKEAAKRGKVQADRSAPSHFEHAYFAPAVQHASANLHAAVNTHPIRSNWYSNLYGVRIDIDHLLSQLEQQFPGVR